LDAEIVGLGGRRNLPQPVSRMLGGMRLPCGDRELVQIMDAALAEAARRAGPWLVCRPGCTQCCHGAFAISPLDALRLRNGMETVRATEPALVADLERRAAEWIAAHGPEFPGDLKTGVLGDTDAEQERFEEFANDAACPALDTATGLCDVYAWRPMTCRVFGPPVRMGDGNALGHCELCFEGASTAEVAACEMLLPHELEARLLDEISAEGETLVAFALLG
jgi:Fe-S-cluster containining protein